MKFRKYFLSNVRYPALVISLLMIISVNAFAEEAILTEESVAGSETVAEAATADSSDKSVLISEEEVKENGKQAEEGEQEASVLEATTMSMSTGSGLSEEGAVSSVTIPEPSIFTGSATTKIPIIVPPRQRRYRTESGIDL